jgi:hypothetical protein
MTTGHVDIEIVIGFESGVYSICHLFSSNRTASPSSHSIKRSEYQLVRLETYVEQSHGAIILKKNGRGFADEM